MSDKKQNHRRTLYVRPETYEKAKRIGMGNASMGIRIAIEKYKEDQGAKK